MNQFISENAEFRKRIFEETADKYDSCSGGISAYFAESFISDIKILNVDCCPRCGLRK